MTDAIDLTVIINAHDETVVSGPTVRSAEAAIQRAKRAGIRVERLLILDSPTRGALEYFNSVYFEEWKKIDVDVADLGLARNAGVKNAQGEIIVFLDADDLISENWFEMGYKEIRRNMDMGNKCIAHTQLNWQFDSTRHVSIKVSQDDPLFTPLFFLVGNYYDALCMAPRAAFMEVPYAPRDKEKGYGFEDWRFNVETMANGWKHIVIPDTVTFIRRKDNSLVQELSSQKHLLWPLDELTIENIHRSILKK